MSLIKQLFPLQLKFTPASAEVNWTRIETLVHGPGAGEDKRSSNSAVFAVLNAISTAYPEPPLLVYRRKKDDKSEKIPDHPLQLLLDQPTPDGELSFEEIQFWTAWALHIDGNAYWLKVRSGNADTGNVIQLWPISPSLMAPVTAKDSGDWISYYGYQDRPNHVEPVPVHNVVHFRLGLDDRDMRKGLAPLKNLVREIATDDESTRFIDTLLKNYAVPGLVVIPQNGVTVQDESEADRISARMTSKFTGGNRGKVAVMSKEVKIESFGFSPKDLDISILHRVPEERISGVMGVPAIVAGLGAGLDRATYDNADALIEFFTEQKLIPLWRANARKLNASLKPDFTGDPDIYLEYDLTNVRALQEDEDTKYERLAKAVGKPFIKRNEARKDVGLDPIQGWDEEDAAPPAPPPAPVQQQPPDNQEEPQPGMNGNNPAGKALRAWRVWALKRIEAGKELSGFENPDIPDELAARVNEMLGECKTADDIKATFKSVESAGADPMMMIALELHRANDLLENSNGNHNEKI